MVLGDFYSRNGDTLSDIKTDTLYSIDYQRQIIQLLCTQLKFFNDYGTLLKEQYFELQPTRVLFTLISKHLHTYEKELDQSDLIVKIDEYCTHRGFGTDSFTALKNEALDIFRVYIKSEQWLIDSLLTFCRRQELVQALIRSMEMLEKDPDHAYERVLKEIDTAVSVGVGSNEGLTFDSLHNLIELKNKQYSPDKLFKTGITKFDEACEGGLAPCEVHCVVGSPKSGKSTFSSNVGAYGLISGKTVFHVTLEINEIAVANKYATRLTGMTYSEMNTVRSEDYKGRIKRFDKYKPKLFINYWPEGTANVLNIRSWISRMKVKHNVVPSIIILDYDDCLRPVRGSKDDLYGDSGEIYKDLIGLANHFHCPVLTFAQPQRDAWDLPNKNELVRNFHISHSARKVHRVTSVSSLNFADESSTGILYLDLNRRGTSNVKIKMKRELYKALFLQDE